MQGRGNMHEILEIGALFNLQYLVEQHQWTSANSQGLPPEYLDYLSLSVRYEKKWEGENYITSIYIVHSLLKPIHTSLELYNTGVKNHASHDTNGTRRNCMSYISWQYSLNSRKYRSIDSYLTLPELGSKNLNSNLRMVDFPVQNYKFEACQKWTCIIIKKQRIFKSQKTQQAPYLNLTEAFHVLVVGISYKNWIILSFNIIGKPVMKRKFCSNEVGYNLL